MLGQGLSMVHSFSSIALFLIALALGYMVIYFANREEKKLRITGFVIGIVIIVIASAAIIGKLVMRAKLCHMMKCCPKMGMMHKGNCMEHERMERENVAASPEQVK